ncbi:hypothetical protein MKW94_022731, partial [Papaver nudicaule]|nr:hypothetical protein [Papaver nudicaule]
MKELKACPFWDFYEPFHLKIVDGKELVKTADACRMMLARFTSLSKHGRDLECFNLSSIKDRKDLILQITPAHAAVIFGFQRIEQRPDHEMKNDKTKKETDIYDYLKNCLADDSKAKDFVRFFVLFIMVTTFFAHKGDQDLAYQYLEQTFYMNEISWPDVTHNSLMTSILDAPLKPEDVKCCVVYPLYWFAEVTHIVKKKVAGEEKSYPRFTRWNLMDVCSAVKKKLPNFDAEKDILKE